MSLAWYTSNYTSTRRGPARPQIWGADRPPKTPNIGAQDANPGRFAGFSVPDADSNCAGRGVSGMAHGDGVEDACRCLTGCVANTLEGTHYLHGVKPCGGRLCWKWLQTATERPADMSIRQSVHLDRRLINDPLRRLANSTRLKYTARPVCVADRRQAARALVSASDLARCRSDLADH